MKDDKAIMVQEWTRTTEFRLGFILHPSFFHNACHKWFFCGKKTKH